MNANLIKAVEYSPYPPNHGAIPQSRNQSDEGGTMSIIKKRERTKHANALIKIISDYDRRFFYNAHANRVAQIEIISGHIYFRDDYTNELIHIHKNFSNRNFSHGGTLRDL